MNYMPEKKLKTGAPVRTIVLAAAGVIAFAGFVFLLIVFRSTVNEAALSQKAVSTEGLYESIEFSQDALVTVGERQISGVPAVKETDPKQGAAKPELIVVEFGSFGSGFTAAAQDVMKQLLEKYGNRIQLVWKDFYDPADEMALLGARAGRCAQKEGRFWEMHEKIFQTDNGFDQSELEEIAKTTGLSAETFTDCLEKKEVDALINENLSEGRELGLSKVPMFFVDDTAVTGIIPFEQFSALVGQKLDKK